MLEFSDTTERTPVKIGSKEYEIREMIGTEHGAFVREMSKRMDKERNVTRLDGLKNVLLRHTMFDVESGKIISDEELEALPSSTISSLFEIAQNLNGMGTDEEDEDLPKI